MSLMAPIRAFGQRLWSGGWIRSALEALPNIPWFCALHLLRSGNRRVNGERSLSVEPPSSPPPSAEL